MKLNQKIIIVTMIVGLLLSIEGGMIHPGEQLYIGTIILGISSFCWAVTKAGDTPKSSVAKFLAEIGAKYGTFVYVIHWSIKECLIKLDKMFVFTQQGWYLWLSPIFLAAISILISVVLYYMMVSVSKWREGKQ